MFGASDGELHSMQRVAIDSRADYLLVEDIDLDGVDDLTILAGNHSILYSDR